MKTKTFEVRDRATFIPVFAIQMQPDNEGQRYLLRRAGYSCQPDDPIVMFGYLHKGGCNYDPYDWGGGSRTMKVAHDYVAKNFDDLSNGDVIDVEFILDETPKPKPAKGMKFMSEKYQYNEIPKKFDVTIYTHYCYHSNYGWNIGTISHDASDMSGDEYICIAKTEVTVKVPPKKVDIKQMVIDALEAEKKKQVAEHYKRMAGLQEKIDSLLCLSYQPKEDEL